MKQLLPGTVAIIWVMMYLMWILETIMCLSTELQRGTLRYLTVAEETGSHLVFCNTGPGPSTKANGHTAEVFLKGWRWEFVCPGLQQRGRAPLRLLRPNAAAHHLCSGYHKPMRTCGICPSYSLERVMPLISILSIPLASTCCYILPL